MSSTRTLQALTSAAVAAALLPLSVLPAAAQLRAFAQVRPRPAGLARVRLRGVAALDCRARPMLTVSRLRLGAWLSAASAEETPGPRWVLPDKGGSQPAPGPRRVEPRRSMPKALRAALAKYLPFFSGGEAFDGARPRGRSDDDGS